jgi:hypothetical protein
MFTGSSIWALVHQDFRLPSPCAGEYLPECTNEKWKEWKRTRCTLEKTENANYEKIKKDTYVACYNWFSIARSDGILLDAPFFSGWFASDEKCWFVTNGKWETIFLLSRVALLNIGIWLRDKTNTTVLLDTVACCRKAVEELGEWKQKGNMKDLLDEHENIPDEMTVEFFDTLRTVAELLYGLTCLSRATTPEELCGRDFNNVVLYVVLNAEKLIESEQVPEAIEKLVHQTCVATIVSVANTLVQSAEKLRLLDNTTVTWREVAMFLQKAIEQLEESEMFDEDDLTNKKISVAELRDNLECVERFDRGYIGNEVEDSPSAPLLPREIPNVREAKFPF